MSRAGAPIRIAFVKFGGLAAGGTEKALQTLAANLPSDEFAVTYFYCDSAPYIGSDWVHPDTDPARLAYMTSRGVALRRFEVGAKDVRSPTHDWVDTNFWDLFDEREFDILQTARAGHPEYPFTLINGIPIVDLITLPGMAERKANVARVVHISRFQARSWIKAGGDASLVEIIPLFDDVPEHAFSSSLRSELGLSDSTFVFGMHQRVDDGIYSPVPLDAYARVEGADTAFVLMGGSPKYRVQARELGLRCFQALPHSADPHRLHAFLETIDVFAHGRADGETFSLAIADALLHGKPVLSHTAPAMGHAETIGEAGVIPRSRWGYARAMRRLANRDIRYRRLSEAAKRRYDTQFSLAVNIERWRDIYRDVAGRRS